MHIGLPTVDGESLPEGTLRVFEWAENFENNRTRELKQMLWVPIPNKQDGEGFTDLMSHPRGISHLGAWLLLLQVASKCEPRGTLLRRVGGRVEAYTPESLARRTKSPPDVMTEAIRRLLQIGWLEQIPHNVAPSCDDLAPSCDVVPMEWNGMEENGREGKEKHSSSSGDDGKSKSPYTDSFETWWGRYPRKVGKRQAFKAFQRALKRANGGILLDAVEAFSEAWEDSTADQRDFCPHPATWLNRDSWEDDRTQWGPSKENGRGGKDYSSAVGPEGV